MTMLSFIRGKAFSAITASALLLASGFIAQPPAVYAGGIQVVTTTADSGPGSLRAAITAVNADASATIASPATISFSIPAAGMQTINVLTALPPITKPVVIDGLSQPGASCGDSVSARSLLISIRGQGNSVAMSGLVLQGGGSTVQGLGISYFRSGNLVSTGATGGDLVRCNNIGMRADGTLDTIASNGVTMSGNPVTTASLDVSSPNTVVGGKNRTPGICDGDCNAIVGESSNNNQQAVLLRFGPHLGTAYNGFTSSSSAAGGRMQGNFVGLLQNGQTPPSAFKSSRLLFITSSDTASAAAPLPPHVIPSSGNYLIGGLAGTALDPLAANVFSASKFRDGIDCDSGTGCASGIRIHGNYIGTGPTGNETVDAAGRIYGNARDGIQIEGQEAADIQANIISGNGSNGINVGSISSNTLIKNNTIGLTVSGAADGNGWYSTAFASGPNVGLGGVSVNANAASGNGITVGGYGGTTPNRDVANLVIDGNTVVNSSRAGIIAVGGSGNTTIQNNVIGQGGHGNGAAGIVMMTAGNTIQNNVISYNGGAGVTILRNTNTLMGTVFGAFTPLPTYAAQNVITTNSIFANTGLGIDLTTISSPWAAGGNTLAFPYAWLPGVTGNDGSLSVAPPTVAGGFGNQDQDYPVITSANLNVATGTLTVAGHVGAIGGSAVFSGAAVEVFQGHNSPADQNGEVYAGDGLSVVHPEGKDFLGTCPVSATGTFSCDISVTASKIIESPMLTSTATLGHTTSEFGPIFNAQIRGSISGTVYLEGLVTGTGDLYPIEGVTVELYDALGSLIASTQTDSSGYYSFDVLPLGDYTVLEIQPVLYGEGTVEPDDSIAVTLTATVPDSQENNFSELWSSISGTVYLDGTLTPLKDVEVVLTGTDALGNAISPVTTFTDVNGHYSFVGLPAGDYVITEAQPAGYGQGVVEADGVISVSLAVEDSVVDQNFSETTTSIAGTVYVDGTLAPLAGVSISLSGVDANGESVTASTLTDENGNYQFSDLLSGTYTVTETQPTGYGQGTVESDDIIDALVVTPGEAVTEQDFSESLGTVSGQVTLDGSGDAVIGVEVVLTGTDVNGTAVSLTTHTATDGSYIFSGLLAGDYVVTETQPVGYGQGVTEPDDVISVTLAAGKDLPDNNFSEALASISGEVFLDGSNTPLGAVSISLTGTGVNGAAVSLTTTTNVDGTYSFTGLLAGDYTVTQTQPIDWVAGAVAATNVINVTLAAGDAVVAQNFSETGHRVSGAVSVDGSNDPLEGVTITLTGTSLNGTIISLSTSTLADGSYTFSDLPNGDYTITETQPGGYGAGAVEPDNSISVTLTATSGDSLDNDFSETLGTISGRVTLDGSDVPLANWPVTLYLDGSEVAHTTTALDGTYSFTGLRSGEYVIEETQHLGYGEGVVEPDDSITVILTPGQTSADNNFSETLSSISGRVFLDGTTAPLAGVTVLLTGTADDGSVVSLSTTTDATGAFSFTNLLSGDYTLTETQPLTYGNGAVQPSNVYHLSLPPGSVTPNQNFSETPGALSGRVFVDGSNAPIAGTSITLTGTDLSGAPVTRSTMTDATGAYLFADLPAGSYTVTETQPAGYGPGMVVPGNVRSAVPVSAGSTATGNDFSESLGSISGRVVLVPGQTPIAGVVVDLRDASGTVVATTVTLADGSYTFPGLRSGVYTITERQPQNYASVSATPGSAGGAVDTTKNVIASINLQPGQNAPGYVFTEKVYKKPVTGVSLPLTGMLMLLGVGLVLMAAGYRRRYYSVR